MYTPKNSRDETNETMVFCGQIDSEEDEDRENFRYCYSHGFWRCTRKFWRFWKRQAINGNLLRVVTVIVDILQKYSVILYDNARIFPELLEPFFFTTTSSTD